jgi:general secretion pathway protein K
MPRFITRGEIGRRGRDRSGFAFIGVLFLILLLSGFALAILTIVHNDSARAHTELDEVKAEGLADGGIFLVLHKLCNARLVNEVPIDGQIISVEVGGQKVETAVQDEAGKIDLNFGSRDLLQSLFASAGLTPDDSAHLADTIQNIRNTTFKPMADAAQFPGSSSLPNSPALPFQAIEQVRALPGMKDEVFRRVRPALTVYSKQSVVQTATAPPAVLAALPGMDQSKIAEILEQRRLRPVTAGDIGFAETSSAQGGVMTGRAFTIFARATAGHSGFRRRAVAMITGDPTRPYRILDWGLDYP